MSKSQEYCPIIWYYEWLWSQMQGKKVGFHLWDMRETRLRLLYRGNFNLIRRQHTSSHGSPCGIPPCCVGRRCRPQFRRFQRCSWWKIFRPCQSPEEFCLACPTTWRWCCRSTGFHRLHGSVRTARRERDSRWVALTESAAESIQWVQQYEAATTDI